MIKKAIALTSFAAGYVAGAAAGRERYEQIRRTVLGIKNDPHVQEFAGEAAEFAKEHGSALTDKVAHKVTGHNGSPPEASVSAQQSPPGPDGSLHL
jgi:hypothetical protein